jgi:Domain of unknown function (DUF4279)
MNMNDNPRRYLDIPIRTTPKSGTFPIRFTMTFRVYSGEMPPSRISALFGIDATSAVGIESSSEPIGADDFRIGKLNGWFLESEERLEDRNPRTHIDWFLATVGPLQPKLADILKLPGTKAEVGIIIWARNGGYLSLNPSDISRLSALGLPVWFSFADYGDDEEG